MKDLGHVQLTYMMQYLYTIQAAVLSFFCNIQDLGLGIGVNILIEHIHVFKWITLSI